MNSTFLNDSCHTWNVRQLQRGREIPCVDEFSHTKTTVKKGSIVRAIFGLMPLPSLFLLAFFIVLPSSYKMTEVAVAVDPAEARKRRKEIMQSLRAEGEEAKAADQQPAAAAEGGEALPPPKKRKVSKKDSDTTTKKTQVRYDPEVPMDKDQLAAWRKEARRVRNRESAAASRQRIRDRITELENEVGQWKQKYSMAMERLEQLEGVAAAQEAQKSD